MKRKISREEKAHIRARRGKKAMMWATTIMSMTAMTSINAFADEGTSAKSLITEACKILKIVVIAIGFGLAVFGVINLMEAHSSNDPTAKNSGIKQLVGGLGIILVGSALIPYMETYMTSNLKK